MPFTLLLGFLLDGLIGDPEWMPHPVRGFGWLIGRGESILNKGKYRFIKGALLSVVLIVTTATIIWMLFEFLQKYPIAFYVFQTIGIFVCLANRNLIDECKKVMVELQTKGLDAGRKRLSYIVGRQTAQLSENKVRSAVLETMSENLSDGVIAPLFWFAVGGLPAMFAYKMVNTLDSMIGYKSDRYKQFGCVAARIDDMANIIPARITALLMSMVALSPRGLKFAIRYGYKHASPNSGYPEAALAGILDCQFGGPNMYHGVMVEKPFIGTNARTLADADFNKAMWVNILSASLMVLLVTRWWIVW